MKKILLIIGIIALLTISGIFLFQDRNVTAILPTQFSDDVNVDSSINFYLQDGNLIIEYTNPNNEKVWIEGLSFDRYIIDEKEIIIYDYQPSEKFKLHIGEESDIYEFGAEGKTSSDKYDVTFEFVEEGIIHKVLEITIHNKQDSSDNLDLKTILNETSFDTNEVRNIKFYRRVTEQVLKYNYTRVCNPYELVEVNGTSIIENCTRVVIGNYTVEEESWSEEKLISDNKESLGELRNTWEQIPIQKTGQEKDTLKLRLEFDVSIVKNKDGWGNSGTIYLDINNEVFYDKTNSSWWNSSWIYKKDVILNSTVGSTLTKFPAYINIDTATLIAAGKMNDTCNDLRIVDNDSVTELEYEIESSTCDTANTIIWTKIPSLTSGNYTVGLYYGNMVVSDNQDSDSVWELYSYVHHMNAEENAAKPSGSSVTAEAAVVFNNDFAFFTGSSSSYHYSGTQGDDMAVYTADDSITHNISKGIYFSFWMYNTAGGAPYQVYPLNLWDYDDYVPTVYRLIQCGVSSGACANDKFFGGADLGNGFQQLDFATLPTLEANYLNIWYGIGVNVNVADDRMWYYVDGKLDATGAKTFSSSGDQAIGIIAGSTKPATNQWAWSGRYDEIRLGEFNATGDWVAAEYGHLSWVGSEEIDAVEIPPTYSDAQTNTTEAGEAILFSILYDDDIALESDGGYIFSTNNTGVWINDSLIIWTSTPEWANITKTLNSTGGIIVGYRWYANDSAGNNNNTGIYILTTVDITSPTFDENPVNISIDYGTGISQEINGSDETEFDNYAINWTYKYSIGIDSGVLTNTSALGVGIDLINITINDTSNNIAYALMRVEVNKTIPEGSLTINYSTWIINETQSVIIGLSESNSGDGDLNYIVYRDNVAKSTGETWSPAFGTYDYVLNTTGGANWTANASMNVQTLTVNDIINPLMSITYPNVTTYSENVSDFNYTYVETNPGYCWYSTNGGATNSSSVNMGINFTNVLSVGGSNTWLLYCNDTSNNLNVSSITFDVNKLWYNLGYPFANKSFRISEFINVSGTSFTLGGESYTLQGVDAYYLVDYATNHTYDDNGNEINNSREAVIEILNEANYLNVNVIRTWANMQGSDDSHWIINESGGHHNLFEVGEPGNYSNKTLEALDWVLYQASQRDIRLQLVLINNWDDYGGMRWYVQKSPTTDKTYEWINDTSDPHYWEFHDQFYSDENTRTYYRNYINMLLNRNNTYTNVLYKDDPTIFAWLLANEPRAKSNSRSEGGDDGLILNWTKNMTAYIKSIDTNHLVGLGIEGWGEPWEGTDMIVNHNDTGVDFATFELHPEQWDWFAQRSEGVGDASWVTGGINDNDTIDWWTIGTGYSYNNRYEGPGFVPDYSPALARHSYDNWIKQNVEWANDLGLPVLLQEVAMPTSSQDAQKDRFFQQAINSFYSEGGDGILYWNLNHDNYYYSTEPDGVMDDGYSFYLSDDPTLKNKSESVINAMNFTKYDNAGGSWITELNNYKYDFIFNVGIASDTVINNCTLYLNVFNGTWSGYYADQSNSTNIVYNEDYTFTKQFESNDEEVYWYTNCSVDSTFVNSSVRHVQIKSAVPVISLVSPGNNTFHKNNSLNLFYNVTNAIDISFCELYIDSDLNKTDYAVLRDETQDFLVSSLSEAAHNWSIKCTDIDNNEGFSRVGNFTVDLTPPTFSTIPANTSVTYGQGFGVYFIGTDETLFDTYAINWTTLFEINSTGYLENSTSSIAVGTYLINVTINDTANNLNSTIYNVTVNKNAEDCGVFLNDTSPIDYLESITVFTNCTSAYQIKLNDTNIANNTDYILGAGLWNFSVQRTDTFNYSNIYYEIPLIVDKAVPTGSLTNTDTWTEPYLESVTIGLTESNIGDGDVTYLVYRDGIDKTFGETVILGVGAYDYILNTTGGANWTSSVSLDAETLTVTKISPTSNMVISGTTPIIYPTISDFSKSETNTGDRGCSYSLDRSNRVYGVDESPITFEYSTAGCANYTSGDVTKNLVVNQNTTYTLSITGTIPIGYGTVTDVVGGSCPTELSCSLDKVNKVYAVGTETFNYSTPGNTNYSGKYITKGIVINKGTLVASITNSRQNTFFYDSSPAKIGISESNIGDSDITYILWKGNVNSGTSDEEEDIGVFNYKLNSTGGVNYSSSASLDTLTLTIKSKYSDLIKRITQVLQALIVLSSFIIVFFMVKSFYEEERTLGEVIRTSLYVGLGTFLLIMLTPIMVSYIANLIV